MTAALAQITAAGSGLRTESAKEGPFGFCHFAARPGDLVALDSFYVSKRKGVGTVWQLTAIDTATPWAICRLFVGDKSAQGAAVFVDHVIERLAEIAVELTGVLTDNGPEFTGKAFTGHMGDLGVVHHRIPPRSPNHNAVCERFQGTALQEFHPPAFHRQRFDRSPSWTASSRAGSAATTPIDANHGDFMSGRTPQTVLNSHR